uniref:Putative beta-lactamase-like 1 n=1 Tax=Sinocyclocheilus anshuiensis TaxID=1608454 RepID=A0A671N7S7_9TELE
MTGCFIWQYRLPKAKPGKLKSKLKKMCPRFPEPVPLEHPIPVLMEALDKVDALLRTSTDATKLPAISAIVIFNDSVLWNGNFGRRNGSDPTSPPINEYTIYRWVIMALRLWATTLLWKGNTQAAVDLLQDDVLVADPGTKCHYSNLAFSLLAHVMAEKVAGMDYQQWVSENILQPLGMEDTGFEITSQIEKRMAIGVYSSGHPAPLYDLGWYRPSGQMYSTPADMAKLVMMLLGAYYHPVLQPDTLKTMLTPLFRCENSYFVEQTGTPWEVNEQLGYDIIRKDGDLDGYSASVSLVPRLKLGLVTLMAGTKPEDEDLVVKVYSSLIPAMESAFRDAPRVLIPTPDPVPYIGYFTYSNITFYEINADADGVLSLEQFGPQADTMVPMKYRILKLSYLQDRVFRVVFEKEYPCQLKVNAASVSLESQDGQLFNFYIFNKKGLSPGFDVPGLNTYKVTRIIRKPIFSG